MSFSRDKNNKKVALTRRGFLGASAGIGSLAITGKSALSLTFKLNPQTTSTTTINIDYIMPTQLTINLIIITKMVGSSLFCPKGINIPQLT